MNDFAHDQYVTFLKYLSEGPGGFDMPILARGLLVLLQPVAHEFRCIEDLAKHYGDLRNFDCNDQELSGFVKRAIRLYEAARPYEREEKA